MNENDPFLALSDGSGNEKIMNDIDAILNYKKDDNNQKFSSRNMMDSTNSAIDLGNESKKEMNQEKTSTNKRNAKIRRKKTSAKHNLLSNLDLESALKLSEDFKSTITAISSEKPPLIQKTNENACDIFNRIDLDLTEVDINEILISDHTKENEEPISQSKINEFKKTIPTSPIDFFEYIFLTYFKESIESLRVTFLSELHNLVSTCFDYDHLINSFISSLRIEIQAIFNEFKQSSSFIPKFSELSTEFDYLYNEDSLNFKKSDSKVQNDDIHIYLSLVQSSQSSFIANCQPLLHELKQNSSDLTNCKSPNNHRNRIQSIIESKKQEEYDLEAKLYSLQLEKDDIYYQLNKLRRNWHQFHFSSTDGINNEKTSEDKREMIDNLIETLNDFNTKKRTASLSSFISKSNSILDEILRMNYRLMNHVKQASINYSMILTQSYDLSMNQNYGTYHAPVRSNLSDGVIQKLSEIRIQRENQISEFNYS